MHKITLHLHSILFILTFMLLLAAPVSSLAAGDYWMKGDELSDQGKYEEAIAQYDQAIALEPKAAAAWCGKGLALYELGRYDEALDAFDQAITINPNYAKAQYGRGLTLYELGLHDEAISAYDTALKIYPEYGYLIYHGKALAYAAKGDYTQAIPFFEKALTLQPTAYPGVWVEKGDAMAASGDYQGSLAAYQHALSLEPGFALAESGIAAAQANLTGSVVVTTTPLQPTGTNAPEKTAVSTAAPATTRTKAPLSAWICGAGLLVAAVSLAVHRKE